MKKFIIVLALALIAIVPARAEVTDTPYSLSAVTTNQASASYIVRGQVEGILITIPATKTAAVTVATSSGTTLFTKSGLTSATDGFIPLQFPFYGSDGVALYAGTNAVVGKVGIAESVTATVAPAANTTGTNTYSVKLITSK